MSARALTLVLIALTAMGCMWVAYTGLSASLGDRTGGEQGRFETEVDRLEGQLDRAVALYQDGKEEEAIAQVKQLFMAFEGTEFDGRLAARAHAFYLELEQNILGLKGAMSGAESPERIVRRAREIREGLHRGLDIVASPLNGIGAFLQSFIIMAREGLEALLILGAVLLVLRRTGQAEHVRAVYAGGVLGVAASLLTAWLLSTLLQHLPASRELIEAASMLLAVPVLFSVSYWLIAMAQIRNWNAHVQSWVRAAGRSGRIWALVAVAFLAVYREGAETVLFYQALSASVPSGSTGAIIWGLVLGAAFLGILWLLMQRYGLRIPLRPFFVATSAFLYVMAFRFAGSGVRELQEAGSLGVTPLPWLSDPLGILAWLEVYPYGEPVLVQTGLILALIGGTIYAFRNRPVWASLRPSPRSSTQAEGGE